jgi:hypothetical protein
MSLLAASVFVVLAKVVSSGFPSPPPADWAQTFDRALTRADVEGRTLRELELMRATVRWRMGQAVPVTKGWFGYYLPSYLRGPRTSSPFDRQNAAFLAAYEKALPVAELQRRLETIVAKHRYAASRHDNFRFRAFSEDGRVALLVNRSKAMLVDVATGRPSTEWTIGKGAGSRQAPEVTFFTRAGSEPPPDLLERGDAGKQVARVTERGRLTRQLLLSPDARLLLAGPATRDDPKTGESVDDDPNLMVVDLPSGKTLLRVHAEDACYACYRFLDARRVVLAERGVASVWDVDSGQRVWSAPQPPGPSYSGAPDLLFVAPAPDGKAVLVNNAVIDADTGRTRSTLPLGFVPTDAVFSPDSKRILVAGRADQSSGPQTSPSIWDAERGVELGALSMMNTELGPFDGALAWAPDGRSVLVVGRRGPRLFDAERGQAIAAFEGHERWWDFDEVVEAWLLAKRLGRPIPALRDDHF